MKKSNLYTINGVAMFIGWLVHSTTLTSLTSPTHPLFTVGFQLHYIVCCILCNLKLKPIVTAIREIFIPRANFQYGL